MRARVDGEQRTRSASACRRCATSARAWSALIVAGARGERAVHRLLRLLRPRRPDGAQQAHDRVADQGGRRSTRSATRARACARVRADRRRRARAAGASASRGSVRACSTTVDERAPTTRRRSTTAPPIPDAEFDKSQRLRVREGDARALRERPPADGRRARAAPPRRRARSPSSREAREGEMRTVGGIVTALQPQVHQARRPHGHVRARGPRAPRSR